MRYESLMEQCPARGCTWHPLYTVRLALVLATGEHKRVKEAIANGDNERTDQADHGKGRSQDAQGMFEGGEARRQEEQPPSAQDATHAEESNPLKRFHHDAFLLCKLRTCR
jgi:hypothetical protein